MRSDLAGPVATAVLVNQQVRWGRWVPRRARVVVSLAGPGLAILVAVLAFAAGPASASSSGVVTYGYTEAVQDFTIPPAVTAITVSAFGASGGGGGSGPGSDGASGGLGGSAFGTFAVTPGDLIVVNVGQAGGDGAGGFSSSPGDGGLTPGFPFSLSQAAGGGLADDVSGSGGGGGGASAVTDHKTPATLLAMAAGGGGGGGGGALSGEGGGPGPRGRRPSVVSGAAVLARALAGVVWTGSQRRRAAARVATGRQSHQGAAGVEADSAGTQRSPTGPASEAEDSAVKAAGLVVVVAAAAGQVPPISAVRRSGRRFSARPPVRGTARW